MPPSDAVASAEASHVAALGGGLIGRSWTALFLAAGKSVAVFDPDPGTSFPLVEVMGNDRTDEGVVDAARAFYESTGKVTIEVKREVPGHVANRLQAALWR